MSGRIPREFIDDLLVRVDIVDLIDSHVPLKKTGSNFVARCPFHNEKTPSFSVSRKKQFYHCFGCGVSGNAISFLMDYSHLGFVEAIEDLASFVGITVPRETGGFSVGSVGQDFSGVYDVLGKVATFYQDRLKSDAASKRAVAYLKERGVRGEVVMDFALGYAPDSWNVLSSHFDQKLLMDSGMLARNDAGRVYDRFRGRLMFPIRDRRKRVIGFGGRVLDDSLPKYLNSPETEVFSKGHEVYGLYELLEKNSKPQRILIVEGYMDVIALAQFGLNYAVATLGTATSKVHLDLLFRFSSELVFCFDGDKAGRQAAWRAVETAFPCLRDGRQIKVMLLPQGQDPDTLIRAEGAESVEKRIDSAQALSDFFFAEISDSLNMAVVEDRAQLLAKAKPYLEKMPGGFFREMMVDRLEKLSGFALSGLDVLGNPATLNSGSVRKDLKLSPVRVVIALLLQNPALAEVLEERDLDWEALNFSGVALLRDIFQLILVKRPENTAVLLEAYRDSKQEKAVRALAALELMVPDEAAEFCGALERLLSQSEESDLEYLLEKERREGLSAHEKEELKRLLGSKL